MSIIQDKIGNEFLRNGGMEPNFAQGMIMFSHLPPVTSFTRLAAQSVAHELQPQEMVLKKERNSPDGGGLLDYTHAASIKQEKPTEHDYRLPLYPGGGVAKSTELLEVSLGNHQSLLVHDLSLSNLSGRLVKEPTSSRRGRRSNGDGHESKPRKKRGSDSKALIDGERDSLSPSSKPHICEHCNAAFRSSYHLRRHELIHTGERPFRCSQCNMSFIQKYLLQRHEKIHSGEKPFSCDQCSMRFIQKYHMERHKRTHSGEKPYKCDTCQQYFSRTDRLLKHKRTCGEAIKKGMEPGTSEQGASGDMERASYAIAQGNASASSRKRGKSKGAGEASERKKKKAHAGVTGIGPTDFAVDGPDAQSPAAHSRAPKLVFKKVGRKGLDKANLSLGENSPELHDQKMLSDKGGPVDLAGEGLGLLQGPGAKQGSTSSNYDDALQFLKKRRYLHAANSADYDVGTGHLPSQPSVIQGTGTGVLDGEAPLTLLDASPLGVDIKHDKSGIPDEVLQSLLEHYTGKPDVPFDMGEQHVALQPPVDTAELGADQSSPGAAGDKAIIMHEYSRFLLQALERTSHGSSFSLGPSVPLPSLASGSPLPVSGLFADKHPYTTSALECGFGPASVAASAPPGSLAKPHFGMLLGPPQPAFHPGPLEPAHQQLTPSQELTDQIDKPHSPSAYRISGAGPKEPQPKSGSGYQLSSPDLAPLEPSGKGVDVRTSYQIENFAQAFGSQFKTGGRLYSTDSSGEVDHRVRTSTSEFSGYTSLLADVNEPVSTGSKSPTSQSYR